MPLKGLSGSKILLLSLKANKMEKEKKGLRKESGGVFLFLFLFWQ